MFENRVDKLLGTRRAIIDAQRDFADSVPVLKTTFDKRAGRLRSDCGYRGCWVRAG